MYCTNCGAEIPDDAIFCPFCAIHIGSSSRPQTQPTQPLQPTPTPYEETPFTPSEPKKTAGGKVAVVLLVLIVGIILIYFGTQMMFSTSTIGITLLVIGVVMICCLVSSACGIGKHRGRSYGGGGCDCSGCDCGDCDCT